MKPGFDPRAPAARSTPASRLAAPAGALPASRRTCLGAAAALLAAAGRGIPGRSGGPRAPATLLFASGFEGAVRLTAPYRIRPYHAYQGLVGTDSATGFTWPGRFWGGDAAIQLLTMGGDLSSVVTAALETIEGCDRAPTRALHLRVNRKVHPWTQSPLLLRPAREPGEFYISEWVKLPANLAQQLGPGGWLAPFGEWKSVDDF
ncbi:hypothetical protein, partial [Caldovatus aquaticus]